MKLLLDKKPVIPASSYVASGAQIIGAVTLGERTGVWFNVVIRADLEEITIGSCTNIQDGSILHVDYDKKVIIGDYVTVGHRVILHGCIIGHHALIGMGAVILNGATVGEYAQVAAGAVVPPGFMVPAHTLVKGVPAKITRSLTDEEIQYNDRGAQHYTELIQAYQVKK